jgi:tetratricopeptide (TPR) repeat protein
LVHPYRGEGFGLPVLEAMACGLPVVVTGGGSTDDFATADFAYRLPAVKVNIGASVGNLKLAHNGWWLEPDHAAVASQMKWIFDHPHEAAATGQAASRHVREHWTWERAAQTAHLRLHNLAASNQAATDDLKERRATQNNYIEAVSRIGGLQAARELLAQKQLEPAWQAAAAALALRPHHPEAWLLLAEIARAAGNGNAARHCAQHAQKLAPEWKAPKTFLGKSLKGAANFPWLNPAALTAATPRLSVCLIVKNEEKFLPRCLQSVQGLAAQTIVVDTGSTDRTVELARSFNAEIYSLPWSDDFAAARNAALEHATGDWILILDADEELPAAQHARVREHMNNPKVIAYRLPLINVGQENEGRSFVPRLYRNIPGAFYRGRIHEQIFGNLLAVAKSWGLQITLGSAELLHYGYTKDLVRDRNKVERNLKLLRQAIEECPDDVNLVMNLGMELVRSDDRAGGLERYREAYQMMSDQPANTLVPELREVLLTQFTSELYKIRAYQEILEVLNSPLARHGLTASLHFALGLAHFELLQFSEAADQMRQCLAQRAQPCLTPINTDINTAAPHHCLALCLLKIGDPAEAEKAFAAALTATQYVEKARLDYARFLQTQARPVEALQQLYTLVRSNPRLAEAWQLGGEIGLSRPDFLDFALDWTAESIQHQPENPQAAAQRAEALMLNHRCTEAAQLWAKLWSSEPQPRTLAALILCEIIDGVTPHSTKGGTDEQATSVAFVQWYQKMIAVRASAAMEKVNHRIKELSATLPTAAGMLQVALAPADAAVPFEPPPPVTV